MTNRILRGLVLFLGIYLGTVMINPHMASAEDVWVASEQGVDYYIVTETVAQLRYKSYARVEVKQVSNGDVGTNVVFFFLEDSKWWWYLMGSSRASIANEDPTMMAILVAIWQQLYQEYPPYAN